MHRTISVNLPGHQKSRTLLWPSSAALASQSGVCDFKLLSSHIITFISRIEGYKNVSELVVGSIKLKDGMNLRGPSKMEINYDSEHLYPTVLVM